MRGRWPRPALRAGAGTSAPVGGASRETMATRMKRVGLLALLGLVALACSKDAPSPQLLPPWEWGVTGMKPGSVASPPSLVVCEANGSACAPVKAGVKLTGSKLVRLERGVSRFELDGATHVELGEGTEGLIQ